MINHKNINVEEFKKILLQKKKQLLEQLDESEEDSKPVKLDQQSIGRLSRMDAMQGQAMAIEVAQRRKFEIAKIDAALKRIENDDYGYCLECGEEILQKRLKLDPAATTCIDCASV